MPSITKYYGLGYFDYGDDWSEQVDIDRFVFIDKQLYGLMSVLGNGVIEGWVVAQSDDFSISISAGYGNINFVSARSTIPNSISSLPANTVCYIYARTVDDSLSNETVEFFYSITELAYENVLLLSKVTVGISGISAIDNSVRDEIDFSDLIREAIRNHKHRGGSLNPSKIDLTSEVTGQLSGARIADLDAEKISSGTLDLARIPLLNHSILQNTGLLTHSQLDTFVQTLENTNKELFGEIGISALIHLILAQKYIYDDPDSPSYNSDRTIDENMSNEIAVIPGISPDSYLDFDNSTATIDVDNHYIEGLPATTGSSFYVTYDSNLAWQSAYYSRNLIVSSDEVTLGFNDADERNIKVLENFESSSEAGQDLTNVLFTKEVTSLTDSAKILANNLQTSEGYWSGKFQYTQTFRSQFVKTFSAVEDWSTYDVFTLTVKCLDSTHGPVSLYFFDSDGNKSESYGILDTDEVTLDVDRNNFELISIDLSGLSFKSAVAGFAIYTDDLARPFAFYVDYITVQRAVLLPTEGSMKLRYSSNASITFSQIEWTSSEPTGTSISIRARSASSTTLLTRAAWTPYLSSGDLINLSGTDLEIELSFEPDTDRVLAPVLSMLRFLIVTDADTNGFEIDDATEFGRGEASNITIQSSPLSVELESPVYVDSYYFASEHSVNQVYDQTSFSEAELAILGTNTPISPNQVFRSVESGSGKVSSANLAWPRSVRRTDSRTVVVADTFNDRILELNEDGVLIHGFGSINYEHSDKLFPLAACFDTRSDTLYVVWSKKVPFATVTVSNILLQVSQSGTMQRVFLTDNADKISGLTTTELQASNPTGQIMPIILSEHAAALAASFPTTGGYCLVDSDAVSGIDTDSTFYSNLKSTNGIPLFVGPFAYIDGIFSPTWADKIETDFVISNGTVGVKEYSFPDTIDETISLNSSVSSVLRIDKNGSTVFGSDLVKFSPFIPGRVEFLGDSTYLMGGLRPNGVEKSDNLDFRIVGGNATKRSAQKEILSEIFFGGSTKFVGSVLIYDEKNNSVLFEYTSPEGLLVSDVTIHPDDGSYVVAESSPAGSGRIIRVDSSGNIIFSFGEGVYSIINDVNVQYDGSMVIST